MNNMSIYQFSVPTLSNTEFNLSAYQNKILLIVNVASKCGFTPQYEGLEKLYKKYKNNNFEILAFPCNQFLYQEPLQHSEIKTFCETTYQVTFPVFGKINVNGKNTHPLYRFLKRHQKGILCSTIKWNFTKFLVDSNGVVIKRFSPITKPDFIDHYLEEYFSRQIAK